MCGRAGKVLTKIFVFRYSKRMKHDFCACGALSALYYYYYYFPLHAEESRRRKSLRTCFTESK